MKATDYLEKYQTENQDKSPDWRVVSTFMNMVLEVNDIAKMRNATRDDALISIFNEQNKKANAFIKMINKLEPFCSEGKLKIDGFKIFLIQSDPQLSELIGWKND